MASWRVWIWLMGERAMKIWGYKGKIHNRGVCIRKILCGLLKYSQIISPAYKDFTGSGPAYVSSITTWWFSCDYHSVFQTPWHWFRSLNHAMRPSPPGLFLCLECFSPPLHLHLTNLYFSFWSQLDHHFSREAFPYHFPAYIHIRLLGFNHKYNCI